MVVIQPGFTGGQPSPIIHQHMASQFAPPHPSPSLTVGEAWDLGPYIVKVESLVPLRDTSAKTVSRNRAIHRLVERPQDPAPI